MAAPLRLVGLEMSPYSLKVRAELAAVLEQTGCAEPLRAAREVISR